MLWVFPGLCFCWDIVELRTVVPHFTSAVSALCEMGRRLLDTRSFRCPLAASCTTRLPWLAEKKCGTLLLDT